MSLEPKLASLRRNFRRADAEMCAEVESVKSWMLNTLQGIRSGDIVPDNRPMASQSDAAGAAAVVPMSPLMEVPHKTPDSPEAARKTVFLAVPSSTPHQRRVTRQSSRAAAQSQEEARKKSSPQGKAPGPVTNSVALKATAAIANSAGSNDVRAVKILRAGEKGDQNNNARFISGQNQILKLTSTQKSEVAGPSCSKPPAQPKGFKVFNRNNGLDAQQQQGASSHGKSVLDVAVVGGGAPSSPSVLAAKRAAQGIEKPQQNQVLFSGKSTVPIGLGKRRDSSTGRAARKSLDKAVKLLNSVHDKRKFNPALINKLHRKGGVEDAKTQLLRYNSATEMRTLSQISSMMGNKILSVNNAASCSSHTPHKLLRSASEDRGDQTRKQYLKHCESKNYDDASLDCAESKDKAKSREEKRRMILSHREEMERQRVMLLEQQNRCREKKLHAFLSDKEKRAQEKKEQNRIKFEQVKENRQRELDRWNHMKESVELNSTFVIESQVKESVPQDEYDITLNPEDRKPLPSKSEDDYGLDAATDDSSEDEQRPKKTVPKWALAPNREQPLLNQSEITIEQVHVMFGRTRSTPYLPAIFTGNSNTERMMTRRSSAVWDINHL